MGIGGMLFKCLAVVLTTTSLFLVCSADEDTSKKKNINLISKEMLINEEVPLLPTEEQPHFLIPQHLEPGQLAPIVWREDGKVVDEDGFIIGIPPKLTEEISSYLEESGMYELAHDLLYEDTVKPGENRLYTMEDGSIWGVKGPKGKMWKKGDLTWIDAANEETYELTLGWLMRGGFDVVLEAVAKNFNLDGLMIHGVGLIIVSKFSSNNLHFDIGPTGRTFFNVVLPIRLPRKGKSRLNVGDDKTKARVAPIDFRHDVGILLGSDTMHGTASCNHREDNEARVSLAIYMADINDDNVEEIADDDTSIFPADGDVEWFLAQKGRFVKNGRSLVNDSGRRPYTAKDSEDIDCPALAREGKCVSDIKNVRLYCSKSCNVYMRDDEYYSRLFPDQLEL